MLLVKGDKITFKYELQSQDLLKEITFRIDNSSRIGIVGKNGCGKSTLLKIILRELIPSSGHLQASSDLRIGHLKQVQPDNENLLVDDFLWGADPHLQRIKKQLSCLEGECNQQDWSIFAEYEQAGGYDFETAIERNMEKIGLASSFRQRKLDTLSGGEKTKVGLTRILLTNPSLILLDEPTNNLDLEAIRWLKEFLKSTTLPFVVVSHDRSLLKEEINEIWEIDTHELRVYSGNHDFLTITKDQEYKRKFEQSLLQRRKINSLRLAASSQRTDAQRMENFKKSRSIKKNGGFCKRDDGSGSSLANPIKKMNSAKALEKRIQLVIEREETKRPWLEKQRAITLPVDRLCTSNVVLEVNGLSLSHGSRHIFSHLKFAVKNGQKLAIVGSNGSGKTSLIKILNNQLGNYSGDFLWSPTAERYFFYQENANLIDEESVLESVWKSEAIAQSVARTVLGSLGIGFDLVNRKIGSLSPGEKVKVSLARSILSGANTLILDEPTNYLEIQGRKMLEEALREYQGSAIFVSHDSNFIEAVNASVFDISANQLFASYSEWNNSRSLRFQK